MKLVFRRCSHISIAEYTTSVKFALHTSTASIETYAEMSLETFKNLNDYGSIILNLFKIRTTDFTPTSVPLRKSSKHNVAMCARNTFGAYPRRLSDTGDPRATWRRRVRLWAYWRFVRSFKRLCSRRCAHWQSRRWNLACSHGVRKRLSRHALGRVRKRRKRHAVSPRV